MFGIRMLGLLGCLLLPAGAEVHSGRAAAEWLGESATCEPGAALQTAIRLVVDDGWHTYWQNPGEGGMKPGVEWSLPAGWTATALSYPAPERFRTGGLAGFGYHGEVLFPVTVTPPPDFTGRATLKARISWLTCDDGSCVPGDAELSLDLDAGAPSPAAAAETIRLALKKIPRPAGETLQLVVTEKPGMLVLTLRPHAGQPMDFSRREVFPATPQVVDPAAEIRFTQDGAEWKATVPKSEYAESPVKHLTLVLAGNEAGRPIELTWRAP